MTSVIHRLKGKAAQKLFFPLSMVIILSLGGLPSSKAAEATLGPGDQIKITVLGSPELTLESKVSEAGRISYPLVGEVTVEGLTPAQAERELAKLLEGGNYLKKPQVNIQVSSLQSQQVSVLGFVARPGRYPMEGKRTLIDVLALAGGVTPDGADNVFLTRVRDGVTTRTSVNIPDMLTSAEPGKSLILQGGDVIYVGRAPRFYVYGEVQKPGVFRLDANTTVVQALATAGGLSPRGTERGMKLKRRNEQGELISLNPQKDTVLQPDDVLYFEESLF